MDTLERIFEIQAHSLPITRICINFENSSLFTGSLDGSLGIWEIKDTKSKNKDL